MFAKPLPRVIDGWGLLILSVLLLTSILVVQSATHGTKFEAQGERQVLYVAAAFVVLILATLIPYDIWLEYAYLFYGLIILSLIVLPLLGHAVAGSRSWLDLGPIRIQPSEVAKVLAVLAMASWIRELEARSMERKDIAILFAFAAVPMGLTALQPDFGTATTFLPLFGAVLFLSDLPLGKLFKWGMLAAAGVAILFALGWFSFFKPYQKERVLTFLDPGRDPRGSGYQVMQSRIAVGSGKILGKGLGSGTQNRLSFLPAPHTDFVFGVVAEETGLMGSLFVLLAFLGLLMRLAGTVELAKDQAGAFLGASGCFLLLYHLLINVGMVLGLLPATGVPLPFLSHGGSALLSMTLLAGLGLNVRARRFTN